MNRRLCDDLSRLYDLEFLSKNINRTVLDVNFEK